MPELLAIMLITLSSISTQLFTPSWLVCSLLAQAFLIVLLMGITKSTMWLSYILFLVFLGGMLVIFVYVCTLAEPSNKDNLLISLPKTLILGVLLYASYLFTVSKHKLYLASTELIPLTPYNQIIEDLLSRSLMALYAVCVFFLFFTLLMVVNVMKSHEGPLRLLS